MSEGTAPASPPSSDGLPPCPTFERKPGAPLFHGLAERELNVAAGTYVVESPGLGAAFLEILLPPPAGRSPRRRAARTHR